MKRFELFLVLCLKLKYFATNVLVRCMHLAVADVQGEVCRGASSYRQEILQVRNRDHPTRDLIRQAVL